MCWVVSSSLPLLHVKKKEKKKNLLFVCFPEHPHRNSKTADHIHFKLHIKYLEISGTE